MCNRHAIGAARDYIAAAYPCSASVAAIAAAIASDLQNGPLYVDSAIDPAAFDEDSAVYHCDAGELARPVSLYGHSGIRAALDSYIESLPSSLYVETDSGYVSDCEPRVEAMECFNCEGLGYVTDSDGDESTCSHCDGDGVEYCEPSPYYEISGRDVIAAALGDTLARHYA
jgi:hypothetical protein